VIEELGRERFERRRLDLDAGEELLRHFLSRQAALCNKTNGVSHVTWAMID
jgi:hypothetical protein